MLLIISAFLSCRSNTKQAIKDTASTTTASTNETQALIKEFKPIIQGVWVKSDYIDRIIKTKSPLASADKADGITTMIINTDFIKGDSLVVDAGYGNHEGGNATIKFKPGKAASTIIFNDNDLKYSIENGDTILLIKEIILPDNKIELVKYIKSPVEHPNELGAGLYQMVNTVLVVGNYTLTDSTGKISNIHFSADGKVNGFMDFNKYEINVDLNSDAMDNLDEILFDYDSKNVASYSFKIDADTLKLYATRANADSTESIIDKLKFKLVRRK